MYKTPDHLNLLSKMKQSRKLISSKDSFNEVKITKMLHSVDFNIAADKLCNIYTNFNTLLDQIPHLHRRAFGTARKSCVKDKHKFLITDIKLVVYPKRVVLIGFFMCFFLPHFHILVQKCRLLGILE